MAFDLKALQAAVGEAAAMRAITRLEPAGGPSDKVYPPTYMKEGRAETKYAFEARTVDGLEVKTVLLDSVASQANRMEEALLEAWRRKEISFPVVQVDFSKETDLEDLEQITSLQAPHRIADAVFRDSLLDGTPFRHTGIGRAVTDARPSDATAMYRYCPTALVFGVWDSTGPKGGLGAKFQRCIVSEIVGHNAVAGVKTASRIDPLQIEKASAVIYQHQDPDKEWTADEREAKKDAKGKSLLFARKGTPSEINHGNIPPSIDSEAGGVTIKEAIHTVVVSLAGLRRLRFRTTVDGKSIPAEKRDRAELAARSTLAALALAAIAHQRRNGYDLRSRSLLIATNPLQLEIVGRDGASPEKIEISVEQARRLLGDAEADAREHGLGWERGPITLVPAPKLAQLIRESRKLSVAGGDEGGE